MSDFHGSFSLPPPSQTLLRGLSHYAFEGTPDKLIAEAVETFLGRKVDPCLLHVNDASGYGGSKTLKVRIPASDDDGEALDVCLHLRPADCSDFTMRRLCQASNVFFMAGCNAGRFVSGGNWYIEPWVGSRNLSQGEPTTLDEWYKMGKLLASIHSIPTDWFNKFREELCESHSGLSKVDHGSLIWPFLARSGLEALPLQEDPFYFWDDFHRTTHQITSKIVTIHGDFHPGNVIDMGRDASLTCCDLEFACVCCAAWDFSSLFLKTRRSDKKTALIIGYLHEIGAPVKDLDEIMVDIELCMLMRLAADHRKVLFNSGQSEKRKQLAPLLQNFCFMVRKSTSLKKQICLEGFHGVIENPEFTMHVDASPIWGEMVRDIKTELHRIKMVYRD